MSKQVRSVFSALVQVSTSSSTIMHVPTLLDTCVNACFMDRDFALTHKKTLEKFYYPASVIVIDGQPIASSNIVEEFEPL